MFGYQRRLTGEPLRLLMDAHHSIGFIEYIGKL